MLELTSRQNHISAYSVIFKNLFMSSTTGYGRPCKQVHKVNRP